jgi:hypothetical protein
MEEKQFIVFAYWVKGELKGFRADTFNTITQDWAKIYQYSPRQVEIVLDSVKNGMNKQGTAFMRMLVGNDRFKFVNADPKDALDQVSSTESQLREWGEFELRVHPFIGYDEGYQYPERWKIKTEIASLRDAIEVHKFKIIENEN